MSKHIIGWVGRTDYESLVEELFPKSLNVKIISLFLYKTRGKKVDWMESDWPPVKIKVTVETAEN